MAPFALLRACVFNFVVWRQCNYWWRLPKIVAPATPAVPRSSPNLRPEEPAHEAHERAELLARGYLRAPPLRRNTATRQQPLASGCQHGRGGDGRRRPRSPRQMIIHEWWTGRRSRSYLALFTSADESRVEHGDAQRLVMDDEVAPAPAPRVAKHALNTRKHQVVL